LARVLADFGAATFKKWGSDYFRRALIVNRAQAYIWDGKRDEGLKILAAEDWSAANDEFQVCVAALRQDVGAAIRYMRSIGAKSRPGKEGYRDWPVFRELRRSEDFLIAFSELFGEPFATVTVATSSDTSKPADAAPDASGPSSDRSAPTPSGTDLSIDGHEKAADKVH
jgi:hypothetical protein